MQLKTNPLPALIALALAGCGGGGSPQSGATVATPAGTSSLTACLDSNQNWQCDDGDVARTVTSTGNAGLVPSAGQYVLLETRDGQNQRTRLLVSQPGSDSVTGLSTLRTVLAANGQTAAQIAALEATLTAKHGSALEALLLAGYAQAQAGQPMALAALKTYSSAVAAQTSASPTLATITAASLGAVSTDASWASTEAGDTRRLLSAQSSVVLNNNESNRLYLFDAAASPVSSRELDLIPPAAPALASAHPLLRSSMAWLAKAVSVLVDTASAATGFASAPVVGSPVVLQPGKGIAGIQLVAGGTQAIVLMNMLAGGYTADSCKTTADGNEGLFKIALDGNASSVFLKNSPACVHSGFSLIAADAAGQRTAAWDATAKRLWLIDSSGANLQRQSSIDLQFDADKPPQALAITPGGRYLAVASIGRLSLVDLASGRLVTQLVGDWGNVRQIAFAGGGRRVLLASDQQVHTVALDDSLQLISRSAVAVAPSGQTLKALTVAADGDSYITTSDSNAYWRSTSSGAALASLALPSGLAVQQATLAGQRLVVLARGTQDQQFKLLRATVGLPTALVAAAQ